MELLMTSIILAIALVYLITFRVKRIYSHWNEKGIYVSEKPTFILGNSTPLLMGKCSPGQFFKNIYDNCKRDSQIVSGFYFVTKPCLLIADLDLLKKIMFTDFEHFTDRIFHNHESDPFSEHLASLKGKKWKILRTKLSPAFTSTKTNMMFPTFKHHVDELSGILREISSDNQIINVCDIVNKFTIDVFASCTFGIESNCLRDTDSEFEFYVKRFFNKSVTDALVTMLTFFNPDLLSLFRIRSIKKDVADFFFKMVSNTIKFREENNVIRKDLMHLLIQVKNNVQITENEIGDLQNKNNTKPLLTELNVAAETLIFLVAGYETSAATISFCLYELALNVHMQNKARSEVVEVLGKYNGNLCHDAVNEMEYIKKCVKETLRKYPPIPVLLRECTKQYTVPGTNITLEKGTPIFVSIHGIHADPSLFPNPERFDPERFSKENASRHFSSWVPFGFGPRMCIATKFAMAEMKSCIANLLLNFEFATCNLTEIPIIINPKSYITNSQNGIWLNIKSIN